MTADAIWFGTGASQLAGWLHLPARGRARGGVVLCPSLGLEALTAYAAYRRIARVLAEAGLAVLRFDYRGTGDAAGTLCEDASAEGWIEDVAVARAHLRACGVRRVALVGLRLGATVAAASAAACRPDALVLWDPVAKGHTFLREQQALRSFSLGDTQSPAGGGVDLPSLLVPTRLAEELRGLSLEGRRLGPAPCLLLERPARRGDAVLEAFLDGSPVERDEAVGQEAFIDIEPGSSILPEDTMDRITSWLIRHFGPGAATPVERLGKSTVHLTGHGAGEVVERAAVFGDHDAFGIVSEPAGGADGPAIVLSSLGALPHVGPGRLWVDLARSFAAAGRRVLRFDLGGIGDSPAHPGRTERVAYPTDGVADVLEAAAVVSPGNPGDVVLVGICSGAYHSVEAARVLAPAGLVAVNPIFNLIPSELRDPAVPVGGGDPLPPPNRLIAWMRHNALVVRIAKVPRLDAIRRNPSLATFLDRRLPEPVWRGLMRAGLATAPPRGLDELIRRGSDALVVCGRMEVRPYRRCRGLVARLERTGGFRLEALEWIDHSLFGAAARETVRDLIAEHLEATFPLGRERRPLARSSVGRHAARARRAAAASVPGATRGAVGGSPAVAAPPGWREQPR